VAGTWSCGRGLRLRLFAGRGAAASSTLARRAAISSARPGRGAVGSTGPWSTSEGRARRAPSASSAIRDANAVSTTAASISLSVFLAASAPCAHAVASFSSGKATEFSQEPVARRG
jgi:hypothetical protein